jgi:hypothetical protein
MRSKLSFALMLGLAVAAMGAFNKPTLNAGPATTKTAKVDGCCPACPDCCSWDCCADGCCESCPDCCSEGCCPPGCCTGVNAAVKTTDVKAKKANCCDSPPCPFCP